MNVFTGLGTNEEVVVFAENLLRETRPWIHPDHITTIARNLILETVEELKRKKDISLSHDDSGKRKLKRLLKYKIVCGKLQEFVKFNKAFVLRLQFLRFGRNAKKNDQCNHSVKQGRYPKLKKFNTFIKISSTINSIEKEKSGDHKNKQIKDSKINKTKVHAGFSKIPRLVKTKISSSKIPIKRIINRNDFNQDIKKCSSKNLSANQNKSNSLNNENVQDNKNILSERTLFYANKNAYINKSSKSIENINIDVNCNKDLPKHFLSTMNEMVNHARNEENEIINESLLTRKFKMYGEKSYAKVSSYSNVINLINDVCQPCIKSLKEDLVEIQNLLNEIIYKYDKKLPEF